MVFVPVREGKTMLLQVGILVAAMWPHVGAFTLPPSAASRFPSACQHASSRLLPTQPTMAASADDEDDVKVTVRIKKPAPKDTGPPPSASTLAIEAAFVQAASGMSGANYEFGLMEFIRAARDAYDDGVMVPALNLELSMCRQYTAGRPLQPDEIDLRTVWLSLVYLTFERVGYQSRAGGFPGQSVSEDLRQKFYTFTVSQRRASLPPALTLTATSRSRCQPCPRPNLLVHSTLSPLPPQYDIVNAKKQGYDLAGLKLEEILQSSEEKTPMEQAVLSQAMRICYLAIQAAEEV